MTKFKFLGLELHSKRQGINFNWTNLCLYGWLWLHSNGTVPNHQIKHQFA